jgi:hypothetical protein
LTHNVDTRDKSSFAAQLLAYTHPCRRSTAALTDSTARLGPNAGRYSFTVANFHRSFLADNPAHEPEDCSLSSGLRLGTKRVWWQKEPPNAASMINRFNNT